MSGELATMLTDRSHRKPSRRKLGLIRLGVLVGFIPLLPVAFVMRLRFRPGGQTAFGALEARVRELWSTSADEAVALLRSVLEQLRGRDGFAAMKRVELAPFGKFEFWDEIMVAHHLYNCEMALGHHEQALAVAATLPRDEDSVLQQADCLVAMGRRADAVALLERNLDIDSWRGILRRRLTALGGSPLRSVN